MRYLINRIFKILLIGLMSLLFCHCSEYQAEDIKQQPIGLPPEINLKEKQPGIVKQSQILPSYSSCLNLPMNSFSTTTKNSYKDVKTNLSDSGNKSTVSSPLLMAITQLAGDVCNDLIEHEKANDLNFFKSFDLSAQTVSGEPNYSQTIQHFANSCWGRTVTDKEEEYIITEINKTNLTNTKGLTSAFFICTTMLASPEVVIY